MIHLIIPARMFLSRTIFDNLLFTSFFNQLRSLDVTTEEIYFSLEYALKLHRRCPLLVHIELRVLSLDICLSIVDILLGSLINLIHMKIHFNKITLQDNPCPIDYVVEKRRQRFPSRICNKDEVYVNVDGEFLEIYLSGCKICTKKRLYL